MKKALFAAAFALLASTQAFAIAGVGAHYVMNMGGLKSSKGQVSDNPLVDIKLEQENASDLKGIGFKAWLDILPVIDLETTVNIAAVRYNSTLIIEGEKVPLVYSPEAPYNMVFDKAGPIFGVMTIDMSVLYPFDMLPIIRPYVGAGVTYMFSIPIVNADFTQRFLDNSNIIDPENTIPATNEVGDNLIKSLKDESYDSGIGAHIMAGLRLKVPIIPIAFYANGKYYIGGNANSQFTQGFVMELGGGFAL